MIYAYSKEDLKKIVGGYLGIQVCSIYAGIPQRWLLIYSQPAYKREKKTVAKRVDKELKEKNKEIKALGL